MLVLALIESHVNFQMRDRKSLKKAELISRQTYCRLWLPLQLKWGSWSTPKLCFLTLTALVHFHGNQVMWRDLDLLLTEIHQHFLLGFFPTSNQWTRVAITRDELDDSMIKDLVIRSWHPKFRPWWGTRTASLQQWQSGMEWVHPQPTKGGGRVMGDWNGIEQKCSYGRLEENQILLDHP